MVFRCARTAKIGHRTSTRFAKSGLNLRSVAKAADARTLDLHSSKLECGIRRGMYGAC